MKIKLTKKRVIWAIIILLVTAFVIAERNDFMRGWNRAGDSKEFKY